MAGHGGRGAADDFKGNMDVLVTLQYLALSSLLVVLTVSPVMRIAGHSKRAAWNLSVAMTRGGPGIVLASLAYRIGVINQRSFVTLIFTALVTSLLGPGDAVPDARPVPPREAVAHP
jgi:hypothetical protein